MSSSSSPGRVLPRYPVYIPTKGRHNTPFTARCLHTDGVPFKMVVEREEYDAYAALFGEGYLLTLPESGRGLIFARNWIKDHATASGAERHWQLDDNMRDFWRWYRGKRLRCRAGIALRVCEDFTDRYENIAISGLNYIMFGLGKQPPLHLNCHVYSCTLVNNAIPHRWRLYYNDDTDMCLQVLADGWCTVLLNAFLVQKIATMRVRGGNTGDYVDQDGRLRMARTLERVWPGVVTTDRRFSRPQHVVKDAWRRFDTPLKLKEGIDLSALPPTDDYGMTLRELAPVRNEDLRAFLAEELSSADNG